MLRFDVFSAHQTRLFSACASPPANGAYVRCAAPPGGSTTTTSAPASASSLAAKAPYSWASSTTRRPASGPVAVPGIR